MISCLATVFSAEIVIVLPKYLPIIIFPPSCVVTIPEVEMIRFTKSNEVY